MSLLTVEGLGIAFGGIHAVDGVGLHADQGEIVSVIGPNGAGKTTLFNLISGVYRPASGRVLLAGDDVTGMMPHRLAGRGMSRTFQNLQIFQGMTARENVMVGNHQREGGFWMTDVLSLPSSRRRTGESLVLAMQMLEQVGLSSSAELPATSLSYGGLKRLELARALAAKPKVLLLDEPTAGCNAAESLQMIELIAKVAALGVAVLLVAHDMKLVMRVSARIVVLDQGKKIAEGPPSTVAHDPRVIEAYLGTAPTGASSA